jgi:hypothetical protein
VSRGAHQKQCSRTDDPSGYHRRQPEETALYQAVAKYWPAFLERAEQLGGLPDFVKREVSDYLDCGILERGFVSVKCPECGFARFVAFSCKNRGFCPSCLGRRMNDMAAHLVDRVLPHSVPIRHWVCSMPFSLRYPMGYDKKLCADILSAYVTELMRWYKLRAKRHLGLRTVHQAHTGAVTLLQRIDSALRLNPHAHTLLLDGVYIQDETTGEMVFHELPEPSHTEVKQVTVRIAKQCDKVLLKHGRCFAEDSSDINEDQLSLDHPALSACYHASVTGMELLSERAGQPCLRLLTNAKAQPVEADPGPMAVVRGFNLHGKTRVDGRDRNRLEQLCCYIARPPIAQERLHLLEDGRIRYDMKRAWKDGTKAIVISPLDFIARLCALVPPPYFNLTRFHGILAPNAKLRSRVVPQPDTDDKKEQLPQQLELFDINNPTSKSGTGQHESDAKPKSCGRLPWASLLRRVFKVDITVCPKCNGSLKVTEIIIDADTIKKRLAQAGLAPMPPPRAPPKVPGQLPIQFK